MAVKPVPEGSQEVTAYLIVKGAARALDFYTRAFGATEVYRLVEPGGRIGCDACVAREWAARP